MSATVSCAFRARNFLIGLPLALRSIATTSSHHIKEIVVMKTAEQTLIEGNMKAPQQESNILSTPPSSCSLCALDLHVKHTDVLIISQFVRSDGCMLPRRVTGLCKTQQKKVSKMVAMAQKAGLMMNLTPENSKKDAKRRGKWKRCNTYFDENTITLPREYRKKSEPYLLKFV